MKNDKQVLSQSSLILVVSTILAKIISAVFKIPLATDTFLGTLGFGYFSVAHDLFMPFYTLAISGLPVALSQITAKYLAQKRYSQIKDNFNIAKRLFIWLGLIFSLIIALLSIPLVIATSSGKETLYSILSVTPSIFLCFVISVYRGYFEGFSNMYPTAVSKIIEAFCKLILGLLLSFIVMYKTNNPALSAAAAMLGISVGNLLSLLYLHIKLKRNNPLKNYENDLQNEKSTITFKAILLIAIPFALASLASSVVALIDVFTVKFQISNASSEYMSILNSMYIKPSELSPIIDFDVSTYLYGVRSKAFTIFNLVPNITMSFGIGALPVLTSAYVSKNYDTLKSNINYTLKLLTTITFPAGVGLAVLSRPIMNLLYSSNDDLSGNLLFIYGIASIFAGLSVPFATLLQAIDCRYKALKHIIIGIVLKIISNIILLKIPSVNIYGAALGTLICYLYISVIFVIILMGKIKGLQFKNTVLKPLISALLCGATAFLVSSISDGKIFVLLAIFSAALVYFVSLFLMKTYTKNEIQDFLHSK